MSIEELFWELCHTPNLPLYWLPCHAVQEENPTTSMPAKYTHWRGRMVMRAFSPDGRIFVYCGTVEAGAFYNGTSHRANITVAQKVMDWLFRVPGYPLPDWTFDDQSEAPFVAEHSGGVETIPHIYV